MATKKAAKKGTLSAAGRQRIADAQKRRWGLKDLAAGVRPLANSAVFVEHRVAPPVKPHETNTCFLIGEIGCQAYRLHSQISALVEQVIDGTPPQPTAGTSASVPPGFNVRLHAAVAELIDALAIVTKLAEYLGVEV